MGRRLKATDGTSSKAVIATSLYTSTAHKYEALRELQVDDYLVKPFECDVLLELLRGLLGLSESAERSKTAK